MNRGVPVARVIPYVDDGRSRLKHFFLSPRNGFVRGGVGVGRGIDRGGGYSDGLGRSGVRRIPGEADLVRS